VLLTVVLRLWFILEMHGQPFGSFSRYFVDSWYYHRWARQILAGDFWGKEVFFLRPLYPYILALVYRVFGVSLLAVQLTQAAMAGVSCMLLFDLCRRMFDERTAVFSSLGFALTGILVFYSGALLYVETTVLLSLAALWLTLIASGTDREKAASAADKRRHARTMTIGALAGVAWGLLVVCRPELLPGVALIVVWIARRAGTRSRTLLPLSVMAATAVMVVALVPVRNYLVAKDPVVFTAHSGLNFYYGNNPAADGTWQPAAGLQTGAAFSHNRLKLTSRVVNGRELLWSQASSYWMGRGMSFIVQSPGRFARLLGRKLLLFLSNYEVPNGYYPETTQGASRALGVAFLNFGAILALGLLGMYRAWPLRHRVVPVHLFVAAYLVSALGFYVLSRLRAPVIPFLLMFAGFGLKELVDMLKTRRFRALAVSLAAVVLVYVGAVIVPVDRAAYSAQAWVQSGNILLEQHRPVQAVEAFRRALAVQPGNAWARYSLVMALAGTGHSAEAETAFRPLARLADVQPETRLPAVLAGARLAVARREFGRAAQLYRAAASLDPANPEPLYLLGLVYVSLDSLKQAGFWLEQSLALDPDHEAARAALAAVRQHSGK
jgi:tetratricopeptide (TPR) repeat protein